MTDKETEILKKIELKKQAGCKMLECGIIDKNIELNKKIIELKKIEKAHRELNGQLRKELQLKDKMIDLMAQEILFKEPLRYTRVKCIKEYFTKKASEK